MTTTTVGDALTIAESMIVELTKVATECGDAHARVIHLETERPLIKAKCIGEMIGTPNPLGKPGAVHSASSAEAVVEEHLNYFRHRQAQAEAEVDKWEALGKFYAARARAELYVSLVALQDGSHA
jgi:hypothetical protein